MIDLEKEVGEPVSRLREKAGRSLVSAAMSLVGKGLPGVGASVSRRVALPACVWCSFSAMLLLLLRLRGFRVLAAFRPWEDCTLFASMRMYVKADKLIIFFAPRWLRREKPRNVPFHGHAATSFDCVPSLA